VSLRVFGAGTNVQGVWNRLCLLQLVRGVVDLGDGVSAGPTHRASNLPGLGLRQKHWLSMSRVMRGSAMRMSVYFCSWSGVVCQMRKTRRCSGHTLLEYEMTDTGCARVLVCQKRKSECNRDQTCLVCAGKEMIYRWEWHSLVLGDCWVCTLL